MCSWCVYFMVVFDFDFFFFKQKTAYEMRISDWSSDVCSSDLNSVAERPGDIENAFLAIECTVADACAAAEFELRALGLHVGHAAGAARAVEHRCRADKDLYTFERVDVDARHKHETIVALQTIDEQDRFMTADDVEINTRVVRHLGDARGRFQGLQNSPHAPTQQY